MTKRKVRICGQPGHIHTSFHCKLSGSVMFCILLQRNKSLSLLPMRVERLFFHKPPVKGVMRELEMERMEIKLTDEGET